ncbi:MAG: adenylosuccinate synthase [Spirochaetales bacterium]|uniref:Adenylosuccinate synthetase n=1 Tax=Candidatus Thalassospirochaeta sargassi TaxID=3119039 RepID=A0AAJ1IFY8_9SPIO|nr:adenylosuccinate synthase [Spirochaetales bacterium]
MNLVVVGAQWGDEGKGKIVDFLAEDADHIVRFSGGANAGHTIVAGDVTYKLHLVPSGIIYPDKKVVLGTGMVIDPEALFKELATIEEQGINWQNRIYISDRAHLVLPRYRTEDIELDKNRRNPIGTTGRGIGVTYAHKAHRDGIRVGDIYNEKLYSALSEEDREYLDLYKDKMKEMVIDLVSYMADSKGKRTLFEGAQGVLLDLDVGTYPFVSSGYSQAAGAAMGGGIGPRDIDGVMGVFKAYSTRVGNGPFPSEFQENRDGELEQYIRETGREYGVTTGRPRRCGYLDLPALKYACRVNSLDSLVLTHLDVYDEISELKACVAYECDGELVENFPTDIDILEKAVPVTKSFKGWNKSLKDVRKYDDLPSEAKDYIKFIEDYTGTSVDIVSIGYKRVETILRKDFWK